MKQIIALIFGLGMVVNAFLFVPQAAAILRKKTAEGVSVLTFAGFNAMQLIGALHGYFQGDWYLAIGMLASFLTCGSVTVLALIYGKRSA
jgi:MtN3 and saliva related transmembrane protein